MSTSEESCARQLQREWMLSTDDPEEVFLMPRLTTTAIAILAPRTITPSAQLRFPTSGGETIPTNLGFRGIQIVINLSTADKEASGNQVGVAAYRLSDNSFIAGFPMSGFPGVPAAGSPWVSYGQRISVDIPDGAGGIITIIDPDPTFTIPLANLLGQQVFVIYETVGITTVGVMINGLS